MPGETHDATAEEDTIFYVSSEKGIEILETDWEGLRDGRLVRAECGNSDHKKPTVCSRQLLTAGVDLLA